MLSFVQRMIPVWDTDTVYGESLTMIRDENGVAKAPLMFDPIEILEVTDACECVRYEKGKDFLIDGRELVLTSDSEISCFTQEEMYPTEWIKGASFPYPEGNLLFREGDFFHRRQISVTYTCKRGQWSGVKPTSVKKLLPKTAQRLQNREPFRLLAYGDSITHGANASRRSNAEPFQGPYIELFAEGLFRQFGSVVQLINHAIGGKNSIWGKQHVDYLVNEYAPDLVLLAFGMNDGKLSVEDFSENIKQMIESMREKNPNCEILMVATSTPNPLLTDERAKFYGNQHLHKAELDRITALYSGVAVADITGM